MRREVHPLPSVPILSPLPGELLERLREEGKLGVKTYRKGQLVHAEGEPCLAVEVVLSGQVAVERIGEDGSLMTISAFRSGDCVGGNLLFSGDPTYRLAVTATRQTQLLAIGKQTLLSLFRESEAFLLAYLRYVADNAGVLEGKLKYYANLPARRRVLNFLESEQRLQGAGRILLPASKKALAAQLGMQRTSFSRVLRQLRDEGALEFDRDSITIKAPLQAAARERD